jgi:hypothetical protein
MFFSSSSSIMKAPNPSESLTLLDLGSRDWLQMIQSNIERSPAIRTERSVCLLRHLRAVRKHTIHTAQELCCLRLDSGIRCRGRLHKLLANRSKRASVDEVKSAMIATVDVLVHETGSIYRDVTRTCLRGGFAQGIPEGDEELLAQAILTDIVVSLSSIKA